MPSQEDYLDDLLKDLSGQDEEFPAIEGIDDIDINSFFGVDDTQTMTEEDIEKVLSEGQENAEMQDLMQKSDNNDAVDEDIMALLQDVTPEEVDLLEPVDLETGDDAPTELNEQATTERKLTKEERKAEKAAAREAKKAAKIAAKEAKKNKKNAVETKEETAAEDIQTSDLSDIDELLSLAGNTIQSTVIGDANASLVEDNAAEKKASNKKSDKKGLFTRIYEFLTEEDEDEEDEQKKENENIPLSDENKTVIDELDKEKNKKKKGKKDKKNKKGDAKKAAAEGEAEDAEEGAEEEKAKKPKKEKKPKKVKVPDELRAGQEKNDKKLSRKKVLPIVLVCLSFGIIIILVSGLSGDYAAKKAGREAFYNEDYEAVYQNLYGQELNESEQIMFSKSESILRIRLWIREYELLVEEGAEAEALDSLIQSANAYPALYEYAVQWNAGTEVSELYAQIVNILSEKYHLTEAQAIDIASVEDDVEYSKMVYAIVDGGAFGSLNQSEEKESEILQEVLPEEEELEDVSFVDNNN